METDNIRQTEEDANQRKQNIIDFHVYIRNEDVKKVEENLLKFAKDEHVYNETGQSAVATSLEDFNMKIYELLIINGFRSGPHENIKMIVKGIHKQKQIFEIHRKCAIESKKEHLMVLRSKCRLHVNTPRNKKGIYFREIMNALEKLDETTIEISTLLRLLALCEELKIVFDFNKTSTDAIDPRETEQTSGAFYFSIFCITIGAKNLLDGKKSSEVLGTMAHEFCHCAMNLMFNNRCKPYKESDEDSKNKFEKIVDNYKKRSDCARIGEEIVKLVYECYGENIWHAELIVRVPHMLAHYRKDNIKQNQLRNNFSRLFCFYEELMPKMNKKINEIKIELAVKEINEICGISSELHTSVFNFKDDAIDNFKFELETKSPQVYESNCTELTMLLIYEHMKKLKKLNNVIFANDENFRNEKIAKEIFNVLQCYEHVAVVVNCNGLDHDKFKVIDEICKKIQKNQKMVFLVNEELKTTIECKKVKHVWSELTDESQKKLLDIKVNFQGSILKLSEIWSKNIELVESLPLHEISKGKEIIIGKEIKCEEIHVERKFLTDDAAWHNDKQKYDKEPVTIDEIIKETDNSKVVVLSDAPGNGKSTEFKFLTFKLKEIFKNRWILLIDLKMHTKNFENDAQNSICFDLIKEIINFLAEKILKLKNFESEIFSDFFKNDRVVVLMDGVDEISPSYKNFVMNLAAGIRKTTNNQLWMATRPHLAKELEETLKTKAWKLTRFSKDDQVSFFEKISIKQNLNFIEFSVKVKRFLDEIEKRRIWHEKVTNPFFLYMITELFIDDPDFQLQNSSLYKIYDEFVTKMFTRLLTKGKEAEKDTVEFMKNIQIQEFHRKIAIEKKIVKIKLNYLFQNVLKPSDDQLTRIGLIYNVGDDVVFIHETFKEFFIAQTIFEKTFKLTFHSKDELNEVVWILIYVLEDDDCSMIMKFLDDALENFKNYQYHKKMKTFIDLLKENLFEDISFVSSYFDREKRSKSDMTNSTLSLKSVRYDRLSAFRSQIVNTQLEVKTYAVSSKLNLNSWENFKKLFTSCHSRVKNEKKGLSLVNSDRSDLESESEWEWKPRCKLELKTEVKPECKPGLDSELESDCVPGLDSELESDWVPGLESASKSELDSETDWNFVFNKINIFRRAAEFGCNNLLIFLSKLVSNNQKVMEIWLSCNIAHFIGQNVLMIAFRHQTLDKMKELWKFSESFFTKDQIKQLLTFEHRIFENVHSIFNAAIRNEDEKTFIFFLELAEKKLNHSEKEKLIDCNSLKWSLKYGNVETILNRMKKFLTPQYKDSLGYFTETCFEKACQYQCVESIKFVCHEIIENFGLEKLLYILQRTKGKKETVLMSAILNWGNPEVFVTLINFIQTDDDVRKMLCQENIDGRNVLMEACCSFNKTDTIKKVLKTYETYFKVEELKEMFMKEDLRKRNVLDNATFYFTQFKAVWSFMQTLFNGECLKKMLIRSFNYIQMKNLHKFMTLILQTLTVDQYHLIFPQWFKAAQYLKASECKDLFYSLDAEKEHANSFYKILFNVRNKNRIVIISCAIKNKDPKAFEIFNHKKNLSFVDERRLEYFELLDRPPPLPARNEV